MKRLTERPAHTIALAACLGLAFANATRIGVVALVLATAAAGLTASRLRGRPLLAVAIAVFFVGWWWGSARLAALDRSSLMPRIGTAERLRAVVTSTPRRGRFDIRVEGTVTRYGALLPDERVLLRLRPGRAPPQGAVIDALGQLAARGRRATDSMKDVGWDDTAFTSSSASTPGPKSAGVAGSAASRTGCASGSVGRSHEASTGSAQRCSRASSSATMPGCPTTYACASARRACTTCSPSQGKTSRSWLPGLSRLPGSSGCHAASVRSQRC
jgi:hypothetical protein